MIRYYILVIHIKDYHRVPINILTLKCFIVLYTTINSINKCISIILISYRR